MGEIIHKTRTGHPFWTWSFGAMIGFFIGIAIFASHESVVEQIVIACVALSLLLAFPDMRAYYGTEGILLTFGAGGMWKKSIPRNEITGVSVTEFSGLRHFLGWGIKGGIGRFHGTLLWGMPVRGSRGIWINTVAGRKYLVSDPEPDDTFESIRTHFPANVIQG